MKNVFLEDVLNQPRAVRKALEYYEGYGPKLEKTAEMKPAKIVFAGMGSSHFCSQSAVIRLADAGIDAKVLSAGELLYYELPAITPDTLLVLISQSGESGEIAELVRRLPGSQPVAGITNDPASTLGTRADVLLEMHVDPEISVSTRTYLASLVLTDLLASAILHEPLQERITCWEKAADALEQFLEDHTGKQDLIAEFLGHPASLCYIGRGPALSTAESAALFTRETAKYPALAFDSAEFRHGPFEMVDDLFRAFLFAPQGRTFALQKHLAEAIASHGGKVIFVTDEHVRFDHPSILALYHERTGECFAALIQIAAAQLFANDMAVHLGHVPGVFRQSSKITRDQ